MQNGLDISPNTIKAILKRNDLKRKKIRTKIKGVRHLYNYNMFEAFEELQQVFARCEFIARRCL